MQLCVRRWLNTAATGNVSKSACLDAQDSSAANGGSDALPIFPRVRRTQCDAHGPRKKTIDFVRACTHARHGSKSPSSWAGAPIKWSASDGFCSRSATRRRSADAEASPSLRDAARAQKQSSSHDHRHHATSNSWKPSIYGLASTMIPAATVSPFMRKSRRAISLLVR